MENFIFCAVKDIMTILAQSRKFNPAKFSNREDLYRKAHDYYENIKQKIWTVISPVSVSVQRAERLSKHWVNCKY